MRRPDPDDARQPELDVHLDDDLHRGAGEGHVRRTGRDLAGLRVERRRLPVAVDALLVDLVARGERTAAALELVAYRQARGADGAGGHPGLARCRGGTGGADRGGRVRCDDDVGDLGQLGARHLADDVDDALADLGGGRVHLRDEVASSIGVEANARRAVVVEPLRVADVLVAQREADAAADTVTARRVPRAAGQADRVARQLLRVGLRNRGAAPEHLLHGQRALDPLAGRQRVALRDRVLDAELHRIHLERDGELVHLRLGRETGLHGSEAAHRPAWGVVGENGAALDEGVRDVVGPGRERGGVRADRRRAGGVGAAIQQNLHADVRQLAVAGRAVLGPDPRRVAVDVAGEGLLAVVDHLHGAIRLQSEHRAVDLHRKVFAAAEGTADPGEMDAHL